MADPDADKASAALALLSAEGLGGEGARVASLTQLEGGWSRHTYAFTLESPEEPDRELIARVRPEGGVLDNELEQEYALYERLESEDVPTPPVHGIERSADNAFGGPFFVMDRMPGSSPNVWRRRDRERLEEDWLGGRAIAEAFARRLAEIHAVDAGGLGGVVEERPYPALLDHWQGVQEEVQLVRDPVIEDAYAWAREREPEPVGTTLVHGDYRIGNCLVEDGEIRCVLDWELAFLGDPRFDLSYMALPYHAGRFFKPGSSLLCAVAEHDWFYDRYSELSGRPVDREAIRTFTVLGGLMLIAIFLTGIRAYESGRTRDIRLPWGRFVLPGLRQDLAGLMGW